MKIINKDHDITIKLDYTKILKDVFKSNTIINVLFYTTDDTKTPQYTNCQNKTEFLVEKNILQDLASGQICVKVFYQNPKTPSWDNYNNGWLRIYTQYYLQNPDVIETDKNTFNVDDYYTKDEIDDMIPEDLDYYSESDVVSRNGRTMTAKTEIADFQVVVEDKITMGNHYGTVLIGQTPGEEDTSVLTLIKNGIMIDKLGTTLVGTVKIGKNEDVYTISQNTFKNYDTSISNLYDKFDDYYTSTLIDTKLNGMSAILYYKELISGNKWNSAKDLSATTKINNVISQIRSGFAADGTTITNNQAMFGILDPSANSITMQKGITINDTSLIIKGNGIELVPNNSVKVTGNSNYNVAISPANVHVDDISNKRVYLFGGDSIRAIQYDETGTNQTKLLWILPATSHCQDVENGVETYQASGYFTAFNADKDKVSRLSKDNLVILNTTTKKKTKIDTNGIEISNDGETVTMNYSTLKSLLDLINKVNKLEEYVSAMTTSMTDKSEYTKGLYDDVTATVALLSMPEKDYSYIEEFEFDEYVETEQ